MAIDFDDLLLKPVYGTLSDPAKIVCQNSHTFSVSAIDLTSGVEDQERGRGAMIALQTIRPGAAIRAQELTDNDATLADLIKGTITLRFGMAAAKDWIIESARPDPGPGGESSGEVVLILSEA